MQKLACLVVCTAQEGSYCRRYMQEFCIVSVSAMKYPLWQSHQGLENSYHDIPGFKHTTLHAHHTEPALVNLSVCMTSMYAVFDRTQ